MKRENRPISVNIVIERKDEKIKVRMPETGYNEIRENDSGAVESALTIMLDMIKQTYFNISDLMNKRPDKMQIVIQSIVISEIN